MIGKGVDSALVPTPTLVLATSMMVSAPAVDLAPHIPPRGLTSPGVVTIKTKGWVLIVRP